MSINALTSIMINSQRTPNSFVLIDLKINVPFHILDQLDCNLFVRMGERTVFFVLTLFSFEVFFAKFAFVSAWVVKLLYFVV